MSIENFIESLNWRYATKSFDSNKKVSKEILDKLLQALTLSPSSFGLQPWKFFVVEDLSVREKLQKVAWNQPQITQCSHLIVLANRDSIDEKYINSYADQIADERGLPRAAMDEYRGMMLGALPMMQGEAGQAWMTKQVYIALGILLAACADSRIDSCPMEGFDPAKFDEILGLAAKGYHARVLCPIGYRSADDKYSDLKKIRFNQKDVTELV